MKHIKKGRLGTPYAARQLLTIGGSAFVPASDIGRLAFDVRYAFLWIATSPAVGKF
jgi:hypothetical protein